MPERVEVGVDGGALLDVSPSAEALRDVQGEVGDEELDAVGGEVAAEFARHLRGEGLVGDHHERGAIARVAIQDVRHHERLARARRAAKARHATTLVAEQADAFVDGGGLVAGGREGERTPEGRSSAGWASTTVAGTAKRRDESAPTPRRGSAPRRGAPGTGSARTEDARRARRRMPIGARPTARRLRPRAHGPIPRARAEMVWEAAQSFGECARVADVAPGKNRTVRQAGHQTVDEGFGESYEQTV